MKISNNRKKLIRNEKKISRTAIAAIPFISGIYK